MSQPRPIAREFYARDDVVTIARELLGKLLCTNVDGEVTKGRIVETEAYDGRRDMACHAKAFGRTKRTEVMFRQPGVAYVFVCYGTNQMFNIVTNEEDKADAVLVRAVEPVHNVSTMLRRSKKKKVDRSVGGGPGMLCKALGITIAHYGVDLTEGGGGGQIWLEEDQYTLDDGDVIASPRVGIDYAGEEARMLPWRFRVRGNTHCSPAK